MSWQDMKNPSPSVVKDNILSRLNGSKVGGGYAVVWGPALVLDDTPEKYAAHITVVLIGGANNDIVVVTSGTNKDSIRDSWDDLLIFPMVPLQNLIKSCPVPANISPGTYAGVNAILNTASSIGSQGTLSDFLGKMQSGATIRLVGHSLGGALMSVLALYLKDKLPALNFYCQTFAAPTAGDGIFANYFNKQMAGNALRVYNTLDTVPMFWCETSMDFSLTLYDPPANVIDPTLKKSIFDNMGLIESNNLNYTQWGMGGAEMELRLCGKPNSDYQTYEGQAGYQHIYEYISLLGLQLGDIPMPPPSGG
ncbi:lipase family protein [Burkholderia sp. LMG 21824]|uniref:lipase family protein n=1 Tax=Burkholderia sp. LMG 21824 TaxID=3158172 RepID=UPI003C2DCAF2